MTPSLRSRCLAGSILQRTALGGLLLTAALASARPAAAADADAAAIAASGGEEVSEVVVTANRREQNILDVPYAISAVGGDQLAKRGVTDVADLSHEISGMNYVDKGPFAGLSNSTIVIHGVNAENAFALGPTQTTSTVATYVNDTPVFVNLRLKDLERVEVLKGPQGTLYGASSLGGTVRFIQREPQLGRYEGEVSVGAEGTAHAHDPSYNADATLNLPFGDTVALRVNLGYEKDAGFIDQPQLMVLDAARVPVLATPGDILASPPVFTSKRDTNDYEFKTARVSLKWAPTDGFNARIDYNHQESSAGSAPAITPDIYGDQLKSASYLEQVMHDRIDVVSGTAEADLGFAKLTGTSSYYDHHATAISDSTRYWQGFSFWTAYYGSGPRELIDAHSRLDDRGYTEELRLASTGGGRFDWVAGAYYANEVTKPVNYSYYPGYTDYYAACEPLYGYASVQCGLGTYYGVADEIKGIPIEKDLAYLSNLRVHFRDLAAYGEATWHVTDALQITGGVRAFKQKISASQQVGLMFIGPDFLSNATRGFNNSKVLYKANASYDFSPQLMVYATFAQGFRRGMVNALPTATPFGGPVDPGVFSSQPDIADNYEVGFKGQSGPLRYTVSAYYIDWKKIQAQLALTDIVLPGVVNVGDGYSKGIDVEASLTLDQAFLSANYSLNKSKFQTLNDAILTEASTTPTVGGRFPGVSKHTLSGRAEYILPSYGNVDLRLGASASYQSKQSQTISADAPTIPGFGLVNLYLSASRDNWRARLYVNNLFDTLGVTAKQDPAAYSYGYFETVSRPRTVGLSLTYSY